MHVSHHITQTDVIERPICLRDIKNKVEAGDYSKYMQVSTAQYNRTVEETYIEFPRGDLRLLVASDVCMDVVY